jgi:hypothetical protein
LPNRIPKALDEAGEDRQALFDSLEELAQKYGLDLKRLLDDLKAVADASPDKRGS